MTIIEKKFYDIEKYLLYLIILTIPIDALPKRYAISKIIGNLPFSFLLLAIIIGMIFLIKHKDIYYSISKPLKLYFVVCIFWPILCTIVGVFIFPYWNTEANEFLKNTGMVQKIAIFYPAILDNTVLLHLKYGFSQILRTIHDFLIPMIGFPFIFYLMFKNKRKEEILNVVSKGAIFSAIALTLYSFVEIPWLLTGNQQCENILKFINPLLYDPTSNNWWPPLLWPGQLRSFTYEPSFFGIISMFILPLLWYRVFILKGKKFLLLLIMFTWMIFLTKSRTAQVIFIGEILLLVLLSIYGKYKSWIRCISGILISTIIAFIIFLSVPFLLDFLSTGEKNLENQTIGQAATQYFEEDVSSIGIQKTRSNMARWGNMVATFTVGIKHPLFGVGAGLQHMYIADNIPSFINNDGEINFWLSRLKSNGFLNNGFPNLNSYTVVFACFGIIGLLLYIFPILYFTYIGFHRRKYIFNDADAVYLIIAFCGQLACLLCNHMMYTYPISLAAVLCLLEKSKDPTGKSNQSIENTKTLL